MTKVLWDSWVHRAIVIAGYIALFALFTGMDLSLTEEPQTYQVQVSNPVSE